MTLKRIENLLKELESVPEPGTDDYNKWLELEDALSFLAQSVAGVVPIYVNTSSVFVYALLVPRLHLNGNYVDELLSWNILSDSVWGYCLYEEEGQPNVRLSPPLSHTGSRILDNGEILLFLRFFEGRRQNKNYFELNQRIAQLLDIHWVETKNAYCKVDRLGDLHEVVNISQNQPTTVCSIELDELEPYMFLTDTVLIRLFNLMRCYDWGTIRDEDREEYFHEDEANEVYARVTTAISKHGKEAVWARGFQVIRRRRSDDIIMRILRGENTEPGLYATFTAWDFRHQQVVELSCDPNMLANYFEESDLPFETTPAFFRAEVLLKYKQDPDKYSLDNWNISCRGSWSLRYHINTENQVHIHLYDLSRLPYQEQLYWKSFNEEPKADIAERAFKTDFLAEFDTTYDPLDSLKDILTRFPLATNSGQQVTIWMPPDGETSPISRLVYVVTDSTKEWEDQILTLAKVLVEGLNKQAIKELAQQLGCYDKKLGSIKLLNSVLQSRVVDEADVSLVIDPFEEVQRLRNSSAHRSGKPPDEDFKEQYRNLLAQCDRSMRLLAKYIEEGLLDI